MSPNCHFSHSRSPSATPAPTQHTTCDNATQEKMLPSSEVTEKMPISVPEPSYSHYNGQSCSRGPISLDASIMSNQSLYYGNTQYHPYNRPYPGQYSGQFMYHPTYGMYHDHNMTAMTGRPHYSALFQKTSNPSAISNFNQNQNHQIASIPRLNQNHQTASIPRFVDVLTNFSGARPSIQSAEASLQRKADIQPNTMATEQVSNAPTLPVYNIRTRSGGTTGVPAYTGREGTASPQTSESSFTISYSNHSSYHGSSYQSSLLGHDDSVGGSDVDSSDMQSLNDSSHDFVLTRHDNILPDLPNDDMILFDEWAFANVRIMNLKDCSPKLGAGYAFRWGGEMITETDMRIIGGIDGWYDDNYINCIITVLKHCNIYNEVTLIHFVDPLYGQRITTPNTRTRHTAPSGLVKSIADAFKKGKKDLLMPVNVDENHWMITISEFTDAGDLIITGIEVLMVDRTYLLKRIRNFYMENWKTLRPGRRFPKTTLRMMMPPESPQMTDGSSCGPFMCIFMDLYSRGIPVREFRRYINQNNIVEARRRIAAFLNGFCCTYVYCAEK